MVAEGAAARVSSLRLRTFGATALERQLDDGLRSGSTTVVRWQRRGGRAGRAAQGAANGSVVNRTVVDWDRDRVIVRKKAPRTPRAILAAHAAVAAT